MLQGQKNADLAIPEVFRIEETDAGSTEETDNTVTVRTNDKMLSYRNSKVSRLAWKVSFEKVNNLFTDRCDIAVDLYTGEVIAVESTK